VTDAAKEWLGDKGYDSTFGARPLRRMIEQSIEDPLSDGVLAGKYGPGDTITVDLNTETDELIIGPQVEATAT